MCKKTDSLAKGIYCTCRTPCDPCFCEDGSKQMLEMHGKESIRILQAFILDTQIENPNQILVVHGEKKVLLSEVFNKDPDLLPLLIKERARVYQQLGWEVPNAN